MSREERLKMKVVALEALLQQRLITSDRLHYEQRLVQLKSQVELIQVSVTQPIKTSTELLEDYNLGCDSCRRAEREILKSGVPPESVVMLQLGLQEMQQYLEKIKNEFCTVADANAWLPETRADKLFIRDQLFELAIEKKGLISLVDIQQLQLERNGKSDYLEQKLAQNQIELEIVKQKIASLQLQLHS